MKKIDMDEPYTSRIMRTDPEWFQKKEKEIDSKFIVEKVSQKDEIKVDVMGFLEKASKELGEKVCSKMVSGLAEYINLLESR